jgi:hypothetical protein
MLVAVVACTAGCNALTGIDDYSAASDGGASDVDVRAPAGSLVENGDFELPSCIGWLPESSTLATENGVVHAGSGACLVCADADPEHTVWAIAQKRNEDDGLVDGVTYVGEAWVRAADGTAPAMNLSATLTLDRRADDTTIDLQETPGPAAVDGTWRHVSTAITYRAGTDLYFEVLSRHTGGCLVVDDASLHPAP